MKRSRRLSLTIDVSTLLEEQWTGIPIFTQRLIAALIRCGNVDLDFACDSNSIPPECVRSALRLGSGVGVQEYRATQKPRRRRRIIASDCPLLFPSVKRVCGQSDREASTVHDMSTLLMPENHLDENVRHHLENFSRELHTDEIVFCASEATRAALITALPSVSAKTRVLYQYVDWPAEFALLDSNLPTPALGRFALLVGTIEPRKNLALILNSLGNPDIAKSEIRFVVVGRTGWKTERLLESLTGTQRQRILFTGFVSEFVKYRLLRHCEFLVYPSLYEGFGIPALEAMSLGKPVLAARTSSFPELVGNGGVYFDPLSTDEFSSAFAELSKPSRLAELGRLAAKRNENFTWQRMAAPILDWVRGR